MDVNATRKRILIVEDDEFKFSSSSTINILFLVAFTSIVFSP